MKADIQLRYTEAGSGQPLILLHGNGEDGTYFASQVECFRETFRVIVPDTRGHGKSPRGSAPFTLDQFVIDLEAFMDHLEIPEAHLLGFSDGANIALLFALAHPQRVKSLVLNGGNLFPEGLTEQTRREDREALRVALAAGDTRQVELLRLMTEEPQIKPERLSTLTMPVLVVAGTDDMIEGDHTRLIAASIPGSQLCFLEGSHFVAAEDPEAFNRMVGDFLSRVVG